MSKDLINNNIYEGIASRYIKPSCIENNKILDDSFDLRDGKPPETFVSFFKIDLDEEQNMFIAADSCIVITKKPNGIITLLDIKITLEEINDEDDDIVCFKEQRLPHCGLIYLVKDLTKIQEAKTTLSFLATKKFRRIKDINSTPQLEI